MAYRREDLDNDKLRFSGEQIECCISIVDMVESTRIISNIKASDKIAKYYSIFINNMAVIGKKFGGLITKIAGDSLVLYFPQTSNKNDRHAFKNVMECGLTKLAAFHFINYQMSEERLPAVNYRISADYGKVNISKSYDFDNETASVPGISSGKILVNIKASGVNPVDWKIREGYMQQVMPLQFPSTLGLDFSGVVKQLEEDAPSDFKQGDEVYGQTSTFSGGSGAFAELALANKDSIANKPKTLNHFEAAALPLVGVCAWQALVEYIGL